MGIIKLSIRNVEAIAAGLSVIKKKSNYAIIVLAVLCSCTTNPKKILEKYNGLANIYPDRNKIGLSISFSDELFPNDVVISFSNPLINSDNEYYDAVLKRVFVANAENPDEIFSIKPQTYSKSSEQTTYAPGGSVSSFSKSIDYFSHISLDSIKTRFVLVGFKGIPMMESSEFETLSLFFIVDKKDKKILTPVPLRWEKPVSDEELQPKLLQRYAILRGGATYGGADSKEKQYTIKLDEIGNDKSNNGYTYVNFITKDMKIEEIVPGDFIYTNFNGAHISIYSPIFTEIVVGTKHFKYIKFATLADNEGHMSGIRHLYNTKDMPDTIIVYGANKSFGDDFVYFCDTIKFNGKTKEVIKTF